MGKPMPREAVPELKIPGARRVPRGSGTGGRERCGGSVWGQPRSRSSNAGP